MTGAMIQAVLIHRHGPDVLSVDTIFPLAESPGSFGKVVLTQ